MNFLNLWIQTHLLEKILKKSSQTDTPSHPHLIYSYKIKKLQLLKLSKYTINIF